MTRATWLAVTALLVLIALVVMLSGGNTRMFGLGHADAHLFFFDVLTASRRAFLEGEWPLLWTPQITGGQPFLGNGQSLQLYPPMMMATALLGTSLGYNLNVVLHIVAFVALLRRFLGARAQDNVAAWMVCIAVGAGSVVTCRVLAGHVLFVLSLPWLTALCVLALRRVERGRVAAAALCVAALVLGGSPQLSVYAATWVVLVLLHRRAWRVLLELGAGAALGVLMSMPQVVAMIAFATEATRGNLEGDAAVRMAGSFAVPLWAWLTAPSSWWLGNDHGLQGLWWEQNISMGVATSLLCVVGMWKHPRRWWWCAGTLLVVAISVGPATPLWPWLYKLIPVLRPFRCPGRVLLVLLPVVAWLCGRGVVALDTARKQQQHLVGALALVLGLVLAVAMALRPVDMRAALAPITCIAVALLWLAPSWSPLWPVLQSRARAMAMLAAIETLMAAALSFSSFDPQQTLAPPARIVTTHAPIKVAMPIQPNAVLRSSQRNLLGYDPVCLRNVDRLLAALRGEDLDAPRMGCNTSAPVEHPSLRTLGVGMIAPMQNGDVAEADPGPPVWLVRAQQITAPADAPAMVATLGDAPDPLQVPTVVSATLPTAGPQDAVRLLDDHAEWQRIEVTCASACVVVQSEWFARGWQGTIDNATIMPIEVNGALRAWPVPAGQHVLEVRYAPPGWRASLVVAAASLLVWLVMVARTLRAKPVT
jgi:hypothetical protein